MEKKEKSWIKVEWHEKQKQGNLKFNYNLNFTEGYKNKPYPGQHSETPSLLKYKKLAGHGGACL